MKLQLSSLVALASVALTVSAAAVDVESRKCQVYPYVFPQNKSFKKAKLIVPCPLAVSASALMASPAP